MPLASSINFKDNRSTEYNKTSFGLNDIFDGYFTGWFGVKNVSNGYDILGYLEGYYINKIRFFIGRWNASDNGVSGDIAGFFGLKYLIVRIKIGLSNKVQIGVGVPLIGRYDINTTTKEFNVYVKRPIRPSIYIFCQYYEL